MTTYTLTTTPTTTSGAVNSRTARITGRVLTGAVLIFLTFDALGKLAQADSVVDATVDLGFPASTVPVMGVLLGIGVVLHALPRTAFLGAVWLTAYLGGAVCANVRTEQPLVGYILAPVYVALLMWGGLVLRSPRLRTLLRDGL